MAWRALRIDQHIAHALALPYDTIVISPTKRPFKVADKGVPVASLFG